VVCGDGFDFFTVGVRGVGSTELAVVDCDNLRFSLVRPVEGGCVDRGNAVATGGNLVLFFSNELSCSKTTELLVLRIAAFFASSLRVRSRSLRISTSIRHSTAFFTSSRAYTRTPSLLPAIATSTPRCSMTTTLLKLTLRTRA
jgi:hypothetical protein